MRQAAGRKVKAFQGPVVNCVLEALGKRGIKVPHGMLATKKILPNTFYAITSAGEFVPMYPFELVTTYTGGGPTVLLSSEAAAKKFDPADSDINDNWADDPEVSFFDVSAALWRSENTAVKVVVVSRTTATLTLDRAFGTAMEDGADYLTSGGVEDGVAIKELVFVGEGLEDTDELEGGIELVGLERGTIDYNLLPTHSKNFIDAVLATAGLSRELLLSNFSIRNRD